MEIIVNRDDIVNIVETVYHNARSLNSEDVDSVGITVKSKMLMVSNTDGEISTYKKILIEPGVDGEVIVPAKTLKDILQVLPREKPVSISDKENNLIIKSGRSRWKIPVITNATIHIAHKYNSTNEISVDPNIIAEMFDMVSYCMLTSQESNSVLSTILLTSKDGTLTTVATDGHRLAKCDTKIKSNTSMSVLIPCDTFARLRPMLLSDKNNVVNIAYDGKTICAGSVSWKMISPSISLQYPKWNELIEPKGNLSAVEVSSDSLFQAIKRVSVLAKQSDNGILEINSNDNIIEIKSNTPSVGEAVDFIEADTQGSFSMFINYRYFIQAIRVAMSKNETLNLSTDGAMRPLRVTSKNSPSMLHIVMPMQKNSS